jgi:hypothetical protein
MPLTLKEIEILINIRNYLVMATDFRNIERKTSNELNNRRELLDNKLVEILASDDFKRKILEG